MDNNIKDISSNAGQLDYFVVTDINKSDRTINVKKLNSPIAYIDVAIVSMGSIKMPKINSVVVCGFLMNSQKPICFGVVRDILSNSKEIEINDIETGELISETKSSVNSTIIKQTQDGEIFIANSNGSFKLNPDGSVTINNLYTFPLVDGTAGQVLKTDGAGVLTWQDDISTTP